MINNLDINKCAGPDNIPPLFLKRCASSICIPLSNLFKKSLSEGVFPQKWKKVQISPIYKGGERHIVNNYRPISKLSVFSKLLEKVVYEVILGTTKGSLCPWISSYITNRQQIVTVNGFTSETIAVTSGVPQGSHLGPLLFIIYVNDIKRVFKFSKCLLYADDLKIFSIVHYEQQTSVVELEHRRLATVASLSKDLEAITAWELKNMVEFNASKTQYCTVSNKRCPSEHSVLMNDQAPPRSRSFKLLGAYITENIICHEDVSLIATAVGKKLEYLFRSRKYFPPANLLTLYRARIRPSVKYGSHIWGTAAPTTLFTLDAVQRRAIRLIGDPALTCHLLPLSHRRAVGYL
nr:unnamed protein product [Callosobruchus chinensis]